jgi:hypothetical protein
MRRCEKPLLLIDVDGVISLFGFDAASPPPGRYLVVDGIIHLISATAGEYLRSLSGEFTLAWCTGWEEKANEYLTVALELAGALPCLSFGTTPPAVKAHWKLAAIDEFAGRCRPLAWIDDAHDDSCVAWAANRPGPTLLVTTEPALGITAGHVATLAAWAKLGGRKDSSTAAGRQSQLGDFGD